MSRIFIHVHLILVNIPEKDIRQFFYTLLATHISCTPTENETIKTKENKNNKNAYK